MYQDKNSSSTAFICRANSLALDKQKRESQQTIDIVFTKQYFDATNTPKIFRVL